MSVHYNGVNSYVFFSGQEIFKFQAGNKNFNFPIQFCLGSISNEFSTLESREVSSNRNVHDFSVDYNSINKFSILNIHKHLMIKLGYKMFGIIKKMFNVLLTDIINASNHT